ncbi:sensor histidine kinase [Paenibacillus oleatilyticus]|uniref:histidine kinase n=1 Tax=Paenibacillus oleatilyticus TaxID=2594886 RepID=A0ABV4V3Y8_9BACL
MRIKSSLLHFTLRTRLTASFIALIILVLTLLGIGYYYKSSEVILNNASETLLGLVKMSNQSLNAKFASVEQNAINMHLDEDLYDFFNTSDLQKRYFNYENDRRIARIIQKYFPSSEDLYSVNLVTKKYTFGGNPNFWIPKTEYSNSDIYSIGLSSTENTKWVPTYNLLEKFYASSPAPVAGDQYVFTATRLLNLSEIQSNLLHQMEEDAERPVLIVNFQESMIRKAFAKSLWVKGSYYEVFTPEGQIVSASRPRNVPPSVGSDWIDYALKKHSGTEYITIGSKKMVVCYDTIDVTGWLSAVFIPYDELLVTVPNMLNYTIYSTIAILLAAVVLASIISGRITLPFKRLLWGIKQSGEGNFSAKIEAVGTGEFSVIIHKFNQMNDKIQSLIVDNYETHVKEMEAELKALNFQFNPHFLYNTLNIINYLAIENNQTLISNMLVELSEMLEYTAKNPGEVDFTEDVKYLKNYAYIMDRRFEGKFQVEYDLDPALYQYTVPKFFLQPFIENALIHGLDEMEAGGAIKVSGRMEEGRRIFTIEDNGKGMDPETIRRVLETDGGIRSIGIENVNKRIKLLYGEPYGVRIESQKNAGTKITIILPVPSG